MPENLFSLRPFPLSGAGAVAQAMANGQSSLNDFDKNITAFSEDFRRDKLLNTQLKDLGYDDQRALLAGASSPGMTMTVGPGGSRVNPVPLPPSMMTVGDLLMRKQVAGSQADVATQPTIGELLGPEGVKALPSGAQPYQNLPYGAAEKMGSFIKSTSGGAQQPKMFVNKAQLDKYNQTRDPKDKPSFLPTLPENANPDDYHAIDKRVITAMETQQSQFDRNFNNPNLTPQENAAIQKAIKEGRVSPQRIAYMRPVGMKALAGTFISDPTYNATDADMDFFNKQTTVQTKARTAAQEATMAGGLSDTVNAQFDRIKELLPKLSPSSMQALNSGYRTGLVKIANDPDATELLTLLNKATYTEARLSRGGKSAPTANDIKNMRTTMASGMDEGGFEGMRKAITLSNSAQTKAFGGASNAPPPVNYLQYATNAKGQRIGYNGTTKKWEAVK